VSFSAEAEGLNQSASYANFPIGQPFHTNWRGARRPWTACFLKKNEAEKATADVSSLVF
jgi:hypothetical protein